MAWNFFTNNGSTKYNSGGNSPIVVASAASISITSNTVNYITGTTSISSMTGVAPGDTVTLSASGQATGGCLILVHGTGSNNLSLRDLANFGIYNGESVTFQYTGSYWVEINRNVKEIINYKSITADTSVTTSYSETFAGVFNVATTDNITYDGVTYVDIEMYLSDLYSLLINANLYLTLWEVNSQTAIGRIARYSDPSSAGNFHRPGHGRIRLQPGSGTSGAYQYKLGANSVTAATTIGGATYAGSYLRVVRSPASISS